MMDKESKLSEVNFSSQPIDSLIKPLEEETTEITNSRRNNYKNYLVLIGIIVIFLGIGSGYLLSNTTTIEILNNQNLDNNSQEKQIQKTQNGQILEEGMKDNELFPDKAQGELQKNDGSITQEGSHILIRPGGVAQTVYLSSSVVDLDMFIGKSVEVWGQTNTAQKAGWLMEVGYIKVN